MISDLTRRGLFGFGGAASLWGLASCDAVIESLSGDDEILVNQVGYLIGGPLRVQVRSGAEVPGRLIGFDLIECETGAVAARSTARLERTSLPALGFSDLTWSEGEPQEGLYCVRSGEAKSSPFRLSNAPYVEVQRALTRALYLQRCGAALDDPETGLSHRACHIHDAVSKRSGEPHACVGGWHDAGDFGKYVATTSVVIGELLSLYAEDPAQFRDGALGLPESGDGEPDILSEMRVGLFWLLKMQRADGAFERKTAGDGWPSMTTMPEYDRQSRYVYGVSTGDTAKAAAALALAARVFEGADADRFLGAATNAWAWLEVSAPQVDAMPGDDGGSGAYLASGKDGEYADEPDRLWAALELYLTTGDETWRLAVANAAQNMFIWPASWANPSLIGLLHFLDDKNRDDVDGLRARIEAGLIERAEDFERLSRLSPWSVATQEFDWGSNREIAGRGRILWAAYARTGDPKFLGAALAQVNYILGANPFTHVYVTGQGTRAVQNPHHRFDLATRARAAGATIPGLLVGGANDQASAARLGSAAGYDRYLDDATSYETNEFAIDYNAALISLLGRLNPSRVNAPPDFARRLRQWIGL
jgi:endoglucanase